MANQEIYLNQEGLERLVQYINMALDHKANVDDVVDLPSNVVYAEDLVNYVSKEELDNLNLDGYATDEDLERLEGLVTGVYHYRGSVANLAELEAIEDPAEGDVYNLADTGMNAAWTGEAWDQFGSIVDLSEYLLQEDVQPIPMTTIDAILYGGKRAIVSDKAGLMAMIENDEPVVDVILNDDLAVTAPISVPAGKKINLDLGGNSMSASAVVLAVDGGEVVISNGEMASSANTAIVVRDGGSVVINDADVTSAASNAIAASNGGHITVNGGNIQSQEAGLLGFKNSTITLNGGIVTGIDNCPIMGNGSPAGSANDGTNLNVVMNGGTLIAHIQSAGYTACGVYVPNSGSFTMNGGEIISDGCGICQRGGTVNLNGGTITANGAAGAVGKVGDSRVVVGSYAVVYDANSKYPDMANLELNIGPDMVLNGTDGDIQVLLADGTSANINDNR